MTVILEELQKLASTNRKRSNEWFFKTGVGEYGEGDKFIGVNNPGARSVAKKYKDLKYESILQSLKSPIHEERLVALLILVDKYGIEGTVEVE